MANKIFLFSLLFLLCLSMAMALPLSTNSRWIVDEHGRRVKLACVSWPSHMEAVVAEGLNKQPADKISQRIASMGFNCVRLTWPVYLATNDTIAKTIVGKSFQNLGLTDALNGVRKNNPSIINLTLIQAFQAVVNSLTKNKVMVIIDNHISKPGWCCSNSDGNGYFGDKYFDPELWIKGLTNMANLFKQTPNVVGMSLRNELRGPNSKVDDWYKYMQRGAEAVHAANPNVLVILSGLNYDTDLSFLHQRPVKLTFTKKAVFEVHRYAFTDPSVWSNNPNDACGQIMNDIKSRAMFLLDQGYPLFVSEWGFDQSGKNVNDNRYQNCFMGWFAEFDLDWSLWAIAGSYYLREGKAGAEETYGLLTYNWDQIRNSRVSGKLSSIQAPFRGPGISGSASHKLIFHPLTGLCIHERKKQSSDALGTLQLVPCTNSDAWDYTQQKTLTLKGTNRCIQHHRINQLALVGSNNCGDKNSKWNTASNSNMHLYVTPDKRGKSFVCLDVNLANNLIVTNTCNCLGGNKTCDPASQWFKIIDSTR